MASQFESLLHPFVIMFSIPLALVGAVLALKLTLDAAERRRVHRPDHARRHRRQERDRADRPRQPVARRRCRQDRRRHPGRRIAPASDRDDDIVYAARLHAARHRHRRRQRSARADGDHRDRRPARVDAADAGRRSGRLHIARPPQRRGLSRTRRAQTQSRGRRRQTARRRCRWHDARRTQPEAARDGHHGLRVDDGDRPDRCVPPAAGIDARHPVSVPRGESPVSGIDAVGSRAHGDAPGRRSAIDADRRAAHVLADARRWRQHRNAVQVGTGHRRQSGRGAREDRSDPRRSAVGSPALQHLQRFDGRPARAQPARRERPRSDQRVRTARSRSEATAGASARRRAGVDRRRGATRSADRDRFGSIERRRHRPQRFVRNNSKRRISPRPAD